MESKPYGFIYKITNKRNNKIYIGQAKDVAKRWKGHVYEAKGRKFNIRLLNAINKYGEEAFDVTTIDVATTKQELDEKEIYWISYYNSLSADIGYNMTTGGEGASLYGKDNGRAKSVICLETGKEFDCVKHANNWLNMLGVKGPFISACLKGKQKTCGGYHWAYSDQENVKELLEQFYKKPRISNPQASPMTEDKMSKIKAANRARKGKTHLGCKTICLENGYCFINNKIAKQWKDKNDPLYEKQTGFICGEYHLISESEYALMNDVIEICIPVIFCITNNEYFYTITSASKSLQIPGSAVCSMLSGRQQSAYGYKFSRDILKYRIRKGITKYINEV